MAKTTDEIREEIKTHKASKSALSILDSLSLTAVWLAWVDLVALAIKTIEDVFDSHANYVDNQLAQMKAHRPNWYRDMVLKFRYGQDLIDDTDQYDDTGLTEEDIEALQVVKYCDAKEPGNVVIIKVAGEDEDGIRIKLTTPQETSLLAYIKEFRDAGVGVELVNRDGDYFRCTIDLYFDPTVLDGAGKRLDGTNDTPVQDAIKDYVQNLDFNGEYQNVKLVDNLQVIDGVVIPELKLSETKFGNNPWVSINAKTIPDAGYMKVYDDADLTINWIPYAPSN